MYAKYGAGRRWAPPSRSRRNPCVAVRRRALPMRSLCCLQSHPAPDKLRSTLPPNLRPDEEIMNAAIQHPLEPLTADEVQLAVSLLRENGKVTPTTRFVSVSLKEPPKEFV